MRRGAEWWSWWLWWLAAMCGAAGEEAGEEAGPASVVVVRSDRKGGSPEHVSLWTVEDTPAVETGLLFSVSILAPSPRFSVMIAVDCGDVSTALDGASCPPELQRRRGEWSECNGTEPGPLVKWSKFEGIKLPVKTLRKKYKLCALRHEVGGSRCWGAEGMVEVRPKESKQWIPGAWGIAILLIFILICLVLSGLFSGLNIGLMTLDLTELDLIRKTSESAEERLYATTILPARRRANWLLCSILIGNCLVNCAMTMLMDNVLEEVGLSGGIQVLVAVLIPTFAIVVFGEIIPQSICNKMGLEIGARTIYFTYAIMGITFPISKPLSLLLDYALGPELPRVYDRNKLIGLLGLGGHGKRKEELDEIEIARGALLMGSKTVSDAYTKLDDVYALSLSDKLTKDLIETIKHSGYSRIPVFLPPEKKEIVGFVHVRDLILMDGMEEDGVQVASLALPWPRPIRFVQSEMPLRAVLREFRTGFHMAMVIGFNPNARRRAKSTHTVLGLITMEDIMETILQLEICDEFDDDPGRGKNRGRQATDEARMSIGQVWCAPPRVVDAVVEFVRSEAALCAFHKDNLSVGVLRRLVANSLRQTRVTSRRALFTAGQRSTEFLLVWEGEAEVSTGPTTKRPTHDREYFGTPCLNKLVSAILREGKMAKEAAILTEASFQPTFTLSLLPSQDYKMVFVGVEEYLGAYRCSVAEREALLVRSRRSGDSGALTTADNSPITLRVPTNDSPNDNPTISEIPSNRLTISNLPNPIPTQPSSPS